MKVITRIYVYDDRLKNITPFSMKLAHFRNILIIFIHKLKAYLNYYLTNESLLYSLLADKLNLSNTKDENKIEKLNELLSIIKSDNFLSELLKSMKKVKGEIKNSYAIQSVIRQVCRDFKSYRKSYKEYEKNPNKFNGTPKSPKPKKLKNIDKFTIDLNRNSFKIKNKVLYLKLHNDNKIKVKLPEFALDLSSVRITYYLGFAYVDIVYDKHIKELKPSGEHKAGIDLGVENLATIVSTNNIPSIVIKPSYLKAFNQWYNKSLAILKSEYDTTTDIKVKNNLKRKIMKLHLHRKKWMENMAHQVSKTISIFLHKTGHDTLYIGNNILEAKNGSNLSKKVNQNFVQIPYRLFIDKLRYKLQWLGIELIEVDESYTSKASCISDDINEIQKKSKNNKKVSMSGDRITRSLFKDLKLNKVFHADVNAGFNILKVGLKKNKLFDKLNSAVMSKLCNPIKYKLFEFCDLILSKKATPELSLSGQ
ncbi:MAG: putative transposase [Methanothermococcus sp.]|uniref:RNA-guided endonuclease InsQ/TnpB family protein n=1 Tax=Methanothermococcus sp. TaxID=2614238 RepID=UPI0025899C30|nr:transposase [Methanothermococcus sp.]MDK2790154.1 putative transposase [Methanothermococcus sp.]